MHITFRQLRLFLALAETGSVSAAAQRLHVTQPTASMQLKEITQTVGLPLYEIVGRKLFLTETGQELAETARAMSQAWEAFEQGVDAAKGLSRGHLRVAVVSTAKYFMPRLIASFCDQHPQLEVSLQILNRDGIVDRLRRNLDDLYIMSMPPTDMDLSDEVFLPNPLVVIAASDDPLAAAHAAQPLTWQQLRAQRFILRERGSGTRMAVDRHLRQIGFKPQIRMELGSNEAVKEAVAAGLGLGVVSSHALHGRSEDNGVRVLNVEGFPLASSWHLVHPASKRLSPLAQAFQRHVLSEVGTVQAPKGEGTDTVSATTVAVHGMVASTS